MKKLFLALSLSVAAFSLTSGAPSGGANLADPDGATPSSYKVNAFPGSNAFAGSNVPTGAPAAAVPEPSTVALLALGGLAAGIFLASRRGKV